MLSVLFAPPLIFQTYAAARFCCCVIQPVQVTSEHLRECVTVACALYGLWLTSGSQIKLVGAKLFVSSIWHAMLHRRRPSCERLAQMYWFKCAKLLIEACEPLPRRRVFVACSSGSCRALTWVHNVRRCVRRDACMGRVGLATACVEYCGLGIAALAC